MKYLIFSGWAYLTFFFIGCTSHKELETYVSHFRYEYDTITRSYNTDFTKGYTGGIDVIFQDSNLFEIYNFCRGDEIKIVDYTNDTFYNLPQYNPKCEKIYVTLRNNDVYVTTIDNKVYAYCDKGKTRELVADLMQIEQFKQSGLTVAWSKPGGDQQVNVPANIIYFRLNQNYDDSLGKYSVPDYDFPMFAKLNIETKELNFYGKMVYWDVYGEYGFVSDGFDLYVGDNIIAHNAISGEIEKINTLTGKATKTVVKSRFDTVPIEKVNYPEDKRDVTNIKMKHYLLSAHYEPLFYNPYTNCYYRIFHPVMDEFNAEGLLNTAQDKKSVLMVLNSNFELMDEAVLPINQMMVLKLIPTQNGVEIYLPELANRTEQKATFQFLSIQHFKK